MKTNDQPNSHTTRFSGRLWGLNWNDVLPWTFDDVTVITAPFAAAVPFMQEHYATIFGAHAAEGRFLSSPMTPAKRRFCEDSDVFLFRESGRTIGLFMAQPADWSTYYMRSVAVLPAYRERRLLTRFMENSYAPLANVGVERIEGECSPANAPMMRMLVGQGFLVTSTSNSERWGSTVRFTKYLSEAARTVFLRQFNAVESEAMTTHDADAKERRAS